MIVIADDITGAAEIAGMACTKGYAPRFICGCNTPTDTNVDLLVVATDTRSLTEREAVIETQRIISHFAPLHLPVFKKTDSALRGHVLAEISTLMAATGYKRAVFLPANPSKKRIIRNGVYYINGEPIHQTAFYYDPEFPVRSSSLSERFPDAATHHIVMPNAENSDDIRSIVTTYNDGHTLFAGAADLFNEVLTSYATALPFKQRHVLNHRAEKQGSLILCGSTQSKALDLNIPIAPMPQAIYDGSDNLNLWNVSQYEEVRSMILTIPYTYRTGRKTAIHLRQMMAKMALHLISQYVPGHIIIEGGATAWATFQALGWDTFTVERELAPGVVQMRTSTGTLITLKPGSYHWKGLM